MVGPGTEPGRIVVRHCNGGVESDEDRRQSTAGTVAPVWRLAIVSQANASEDPDARTTLTPGTLQRTVYFAGHGACTPPTDDSAAVHFQPDSTFSALIAPDPPRPYAVIGPGETNDTSVKHDLSRLRDSTNPGELRTERAADRLNAECQCQLSTGQVAIYNTGTDPDLPTSGASSQERQPPW